MRLKKLTRSAISLIIAAGITFFQSAVCFMPDMSVTVCAASKSSSASDEISRAVSAGIVPKEIQGSYNEAITFRQYTGMLTELIKKWDSSKLKKWNKITSKAARSDKNMKREDGILEIAYAMALLGIDDPGRSYYCLPIDDYMAAAKGDSLSWDYPLFPDWEKEVFKWCGGNYMWGGMANCALMVSRVSGLPIYPYDYKNKTCHGSDPLTRSEAISAVLRFGETEPSALEPEADYIKISKAGTYDKSIITDKLIKAKTKLPEVTQSKLPSGWKGAGISCSKNEGTGSGYADFRETDVKLLADSGFNFTRVFFSLSTLRFPDYPKDPRMVNERELKELDQLIAWGIKYGVHIQLSSNFYLDKNGNSIFEGENGPMPKDDNDWELNTEYWKMLTARYKGISSKYLTFDLSNEKEPVNDKELEYTKKKLGEMVSAIRAADKDRVLLYSFANCPGEKVVEMTASLGLAVGCHSYTPVQIAATGYENIVNEYITPSWPMAWFPMGNVAGRDAPLMINGKISGAKVTLVINESNKNTEITASGGGKIIKTFKINKNIDTKTYLDSRDKEIMLCKFDVPKNVDEITVKVNGYAWIAGIVVENNGVKTTIVPHDDMPDYSDPLPLVINGDGTYTNSKNKYIDGDFIYNASIKPYKSIADKYKVGFMINEFGMFGNNVDWDNSIVVAYHETMLKLFKAKKLGWCYCELYNPIAKHLTLMPAGGADHFQWSNVTEAAKKITCGSGETYTYTINKELMALFRKYTKK